MTRRPNHILLISLSFISHSNFYFCFIFWFHKVLVCILHWDYFFLKCLLWVLEWGCHLMDLIGFQVGRFTCQCLSFPSVLQQVVTWYHQQGQIFFLGLAGRKHFEGLLGCYSVCMSHFYLPFLHWSSVFSVQLFWAASIFFSFLIRQKIQIMILKR